MPRPGAGSNGCPVGRSDGGVGDKAVLGYYSPLDELFEGGQVAVRDMFFDQVG